MQYTTMPVDANANEYGRGRDYDTIEEARAVAKRDWPILVAECPEIVRIDIWTVDVYGERCDIADSYVGEREAPVVRYAVDLLLPGSTGYFKGATLEEAAEPAFRLMAIAGATHFALVANDPPRSMVGTDRTFTSTPVATWSFDVPDRSVKAQIALKQRGVRWFHRGFTVRVREITEVMA